MSEKELELAIEVGTGILPGGKFTAKIRRTWQDRATTFADQIAQDSGLSLDQVAKMVTADDRLGDVFANASERVVRVGDAFYRAALGRLVAAALRGDVAIDRAEELVDQLVLLDATCVRLLAAVFRGIDDHRPTAVSPERVAKAAGFSDADADAAFARLAASGFVERSFEVEVQLPPDSGDFPETNTIGSYDTTPWGRWAYQVCLEHLDIDQRTPR